MIVIYGYFDQNYTDFFYAFFAKQKIVRILEKVSKFKTVFNSKTAAGEVKFYLVPIEL